MSEARPLGEAALTGWRARVADTLAVPMCRRGPIDRDSARELLGIVSFGLSAAYVLRTLARLRR